MLNFIIVDDDKKYCECIKNTITKALFNLDVDYTIKTFSDDEKSLDEIIKSKEHSIYILDLEGKTRTGLEIAKEIRKNDWTSPIIIITNHDIAFDLIFKERLLVFDVIHKFLDELEKKLTEDIKHIAKHMISSQSIVFKNKSSITNIPLKDILYITKDTNSRKVQIVTKSHTYFINDNLNKIKEKLNSNFVVSHRACIINISRVKNIDFKDNTITFDNNQSIYLLSRKYKKDVTSKLKLNN